MTNRIGPMDNSIGKLGNKVDDTSVKRASGDNKPAGKAGSGTAQRGDTVELTSSAQLLSRLEETLKTAPAVDAAKVAEVKAAIASGNYDIDSSAIADAMLRFERSLGE